MRRECSGACQNIATCCPTLAPAAASASSSSSESSLSATPSSTSRLHVRQRFRRRWLDDWQNGQRRSVLSSSMPSDWANAVDPCRRGGTCRAWKPASTYLPGASVQRACERESERARRLMALLPGTHKVCAELNTQAQRHHTHSMETSSLPPPPPPPPPPPRACHNTAKSTRRERCRPDKDEAKMV